MGAGYPICQEQVARSTQLVQKQRLPRPGTGLWVNDKLRRKEGGTEADRRGEERGEEARVRASSAEPRSDSWGTSVMTATAAHTGDGRSQARTHTRALAAARRAAHSPEM